MYMAEATMFNAYMLHDVPLHGAIVLCRCVPGMCRRLCPRISCESPAAPTRISIGPCPCTTPRSRLPCEAALDVRPRWPMTVSVRPCARVPVCLCARVPVRPCARAPVTVCLCVHAPVTVCPPCALVGHVRARWPCVCRHHWHASPMGPCHS